MLVRLRCCRSVAWRKVEQVSLPVGKIHSHRTPGLDAVGDPVRQFQISSSNSEELNPPNRERGRRR